MGLRTGPHQPPETRPHRSRRSEARCFSHMLNRHRGGLEQSLGSVYTCATDPLRGWTPHLLSKPATERALAEARSPRKSGQREIRIEMGLDPLQDRCQRCVVSHRTRMFDELRLAPRPLQRHDASSGDSGRMLGPQIAADQMEAKVERRRTTRGCADPAVLHIQNRRVDRGPRAALRKRIGCEPMRGRPAPVEKAGCRQHKRTRADRGDTGPASGRALHRAKNRGGHRRVDVRDAGNDERVGPRHRREPEWRAQRQVPARCSGLRSTDPDLVARPGEHLARHRQVTQHDTIERQNSDDCTWQKSVERCLSCHWRSVTQKR